MGASFRRNFPRADRNRPFSYSIDPGFVHRRKIPTLLGPRALSAVDELRSRLTTVTEWERNLRMDLFLTKLVLQYCKKAEVPALAAALYKGSDMFCSTETLRPAVVSVGNRARSEVIMVGRGRGSRVELEYSLEHIHANTLLDRLHTGFRIAVVAVSSHGSGNRVVWEPVLMGFPVLEFNDEDLELKGMFLRYEYGENFIEDFEEFARVREVPRPRRVEPMRTIRERAFKVCLAELLGCEVSGDWGGETSDLYTAHLHLSDRRYTGAFVLKGRAAFEPMKIKHLGVNADQLVRLADEPAEILVVQHCHEITPAVRKMLRALAVQPSNPRRYCLIDGLDSLRLLRAYDLYDKALRLSEPKRTGQRERRMGTSPSSSSA